MKQSDSLELVEPGSLARPGPIGRSTRLLLGIACLYALYQLILHRDAIIATPVTAMPNIWPMIIPALLIFNYVVNIGFARNWRRRPAYLSIAAGVALAGTSWLAHGSPDHPVLGVALWLWLVYFYAHLGVSFLVAAILATPGCEMRALADLGGRATGRVATEHHCPVAFITRIDAWEHERR